MLLETHPLEPLVPPPFEEAFRVFQGLSQEEAVGYWDKYWQAAADRSKWLKSFLGGSDQSAIGEGHVKQASPP